MVEKTYKEFAESVFKNGGICPYLFRGYCITVKGVDFFQCILKGDSGSCLCDLTTCPILLDLGVLDE